MRIVAGLVLAVFSAASCSKPKPKRPSEGTTADAAPKATPDAPDAAVAPAAPTRYINICSFNIQWLGSTRNRDNETLAAVLKPCDVATIQELVAPPYPGKFPDGSPYRGRSQGRARSRGSVASRTAT